MGCVPVGVGFESLAILWPFGNPRSGMSSGGRIHFRRGHPRAGSRSLFPKVFARRDERALLVV